MHHVSHYRPSPAMLVALVALFVAGSGTGIAASRLITGTQIKDASLTGKDIRNASLTGKDMKNRSIGLEKLSGTLPAGPAGVAGTPGSARAYGLVSGTAVTRSKGVVSVTNPSVGDYCITLDPSIASATTGLVATPDFSGDNTGFGLGSPQTIIEWQSAGSCPTDTLEVRTGVRSGGTENIVHNEPFFFVVP
jgi:hypothetical protein